jgi:hypothetical protein
VAFPELILRKPASFIVHHKGGRCCSTVSQMFFRLELWNCAFFGMNYATSFCDPNKRFPKTELFIFLKEQAFTGIFAFHLTFILTLFSETSNPLVFQRNLRISLSHLVGKEKRHVQYVLMKSDKILY